MRTWFICLLLVLASLTACQSDPAPLPTIAPVAQLPTLTPTKPTLPATRDLTLLTVTPEPTIVPTLAPTASPTAVRPLINITEPKENTNLPQNQEASIFGLVQLEKEDSVLVELITSNGRTLITGTATLEEFGWQAHFVIPPYVSGTAKVRASILNSQKEVLATTEIGIRIQTDTTVSRYLDLYRPLAKSTAVSGYNLFFDGRAQLPVNNKVVVSLWANDCQEKIAQQSFILTGSGYWQGFIIAPRDISGPACAVASFGTPGEETWREVQLPIEILPIDNDEAKGVTIGNPPPNTTVDAGQELTLYGTAFNISEGEVHVRLLLENGRILSENVVLTDYWGYWELSVILPFDAEGPTQITAFSGTEGEGDYTETKAYFTINPVPTPTFIPLPTPLPIPIGTPTPNG